MRRPRPSIAAVFAVVFAVLASVPGFAQASLDGLFDFSASVQSLAAAAEAGTPIPKGRYVLLTGNLRAAEVREGTAFSVRLEIVAGEWIGTSKVVLRRVSVDYVGAAFESSFDKDSPEYIRLGSTVLIVARVADTRLGEDGIRRVYLEGVHIRALD